MKKKHTNYRKPKLSTTTKQASKSLLNSLSSAANKTFQSLARQHSETNKTNHRKINVMAAQQNINYLLASSSFIVRRMRSSNKAHARLVATGKEDGCLRTAYEWVIDYLVFMVEYVWRFIKTIIIFFMLLIFRIVAITFFTAAVFYLLYKFIAA